MARKGEKMVLFGTFGNKSGTIDVTDPCYDADTWCREVVEGVLPGIYNCYYHKGVLKGWGERIWCCRIVHEDFPDIINKSPRRGGSVGVDAGLCGFLIISPTTTMTSGATFATIWSETATPLTSFWSTAALPAAA